MGLFDEKQLPIDGEPSPDLKAFLESNPLGLLPPDAVVHKACHDLGWFFFNGDAMGSELRDLGRLGFERKELVIVCYDDKRPSIWPAKFVEDDDMCYSLDKLLFLDGKRAKELALTDS